LTPAALKPSAQFITGVMALAPYWDPQSALEIIWTVVYCSCVGNSEPPSLRRLPQPETVTSVPTADSSVPMGSVDQPMALAPVPSSRSASMYRSAMS
jgi:hypothetical protein